MFISGRILILQVMLISHVLMMETEIDWNIKLKQIFDNSLITHIPPDITFNINEDKVVFEIDAHKMVMGMASPVFNKMFFKNASLDRFATELFVRGTTKGAFNIMKNAIYGITPVRSSLKGKSAREMFLVLDLVSRYQIRELRRAVQTHLASFPLTEDTVLEVASTAMEQLPAFEEEARKLLDRCAEFLKPKLSSVENVLDYFAQHTDNKETLHELLIIIKDNIDNGRSIATTLDTQNKRAKNLSNPVFLNSLEGKPAPEVFVFLDLMSIDKTSELREFLHKYLVSFPLPKDTVVEAAWDAKETKNEYGVGDKNSGDIRGGRDGSRRDGSRFEIGYTKESRDPFRDENGDKVGRDGERDESGYKESDPFGAENSNNDSRGGEDKSRDKDGGGNKNGYEGRDADGDEWKYNKDDYESGHEGKDKYGGDPFGDENGDKGGKDGDGGDESRDKDGGGNKNVYEGRDADGDEWKYNKDDYGSGHEGKDKYGGDLFGDKNGDKGGKYGGGGDESRDKDGGGDNNGYKDKDVDGDKWKYNKDKEGSGQEGKDKYGGGQDIALYGDGIEGELWRYRSGSGYHRDRDGNRYREEDQHVRRRDDEGYRSQGEYGSRDSGGFRDGHRDDGGFRDGDGFRDASRDNYGYKSEGRKYSGRYKEDGRSEIGEFESVNGFRGSRDSGRYRGDVLEYIGDKRRDSTGYIGNEIQDSRGFIGNENQDGRGYKKVITYSRGRDYGGLRGDIDHGNVREFGKNTDFGRYGVGEYRITGHKNGEGYKFGGVRDSGEYRGNNGGRNFRGYIESEFGDYGGGEYGGKRGPVNVGLPFKRSREDFGEYGRRPIDVVDDYGHYGSFGRN